jgi:hypothetical protein
MKNISFVLLSFLVVTSCEKSNEDAYNYMKGGDWIAQHIEIPVSNNMDSVHIIGRTETLDDYGYADMKISIYHIERNKLITTSDIGDITEYAYGEFGFTSNIVDADSAIFIFDNQNKLPKVESFGIFAMFDKNNGDFIEDTFIHKRSESEMALLIDAGNKFWIVFKR